MAIGISSILCALALVLILGLSSNAQQTGPAGQSAAFRHVIAQTQVPTTSPAEEGTFKAIVLHPAGRSDFEELEKGINTVGGVRQVPIEYHALDNPRTAALLKKYGIRMAPNQTMIVFQAPNEAITWGGPEEALINLNANVVFPTPRMCAVIKVAQTGKDVLLVFSDDGRTNGEQLVNAATDYVNAPANKAELFVIDPDDPANQDIIARTKLPPDSLKDARMLLLVGGRVQGQLTGSVDSTAIAALKKSCSGKAGCC
ncbi:MAG TPA: hypothetical protein VM118_06565 [Acidobacteriota bacterium]|nr:hypothetical protein [Acidobacteriota bacterium]